MRSRFTRAYARAFYDLPSADASRCCAAITIGALRRQFHAFFTPLAYALRHMPMLSPLTFATVLLRVDAAIDAAPGYAGHVMV